MAMKECLKTDYRFKRAEAIKIVKHKASNFAYPERYDHISMESKTDRQGRESWRIIAFVKVDERKGRKAKTRNELKPKPWELE